MGQREAVVASDLQNDLVYAHHANIDRYERLLKSPLENHVREFIERRLDEEEEALRKIAHRTVQIDCSNTA